MTDAELGARVRRLDDIANSNAFIGKEVRKMLRPRRPDARMVADALHRYMETNGKTQIQMGEMIGVQQKMISSWLNAKTTRFADKSLRKLAFLFNGGENK